MLVLSRKRNESIVVGEGVVITVVEIRGKRVRLAIQAALEIPVMRSELLSTGASREGARTRVLALANDESSEQPAHGELPAPVLRSSLNTATPGADSHRSSPGHGARRHRPR